MNTVRVTIVMTLIFSFLLAAVVSGQNRRASRKPATNTAAMSDSAPFWTGNPDADAFQKRMDERLGLAQKALDQVMAVRGQRTLENTLKPYDEILLHLDAVSSQSSLMEAVHPEARLREVAEKETQKASAFATELSLNRAVYDAITALDVSRADQETRYYVQRTLRDFRLAGVDRDDATRTKIKALRDELVQIGQEFERHIREDVHKVTVNDASELAGLPEDYIARHKPDPQGHITLTTDYPDSLPIFSYARNEELRKRMYMEYNNRAFPMNKAVLDRLIAKRHELANLLGFRTWADYITADKMVGTARHASDFIDQIVEASGTKAAREYQELLKRKQQDVPGATAVNAWESSYYSELVRKTNYSFDSQTVRPYFSYDRVKQGVLDVTSRLFDVTFRKIENAPVWDPSVEAYEMLENGQVSGRFYLDMHPRENKYKHAAQFNVRTGVEGRQIPEAALICNLPGGEAGDPGLMTHDDVVTFFHEFGHLLHSLFAGHHRWIGIGGISTEWDFVEAPSQMLEEWTWDPTTLQTFARHYQTNEPIPTALVRQMKRANEFGKGLGVRRQMVYAKLSLSAYDRNPSEVDLDEMIKGLTKQYQPFSFVEGTHFQTAFGHLDDYSAIYYTYMWSLVIAKDMFSRFDHNHMLAPGVAKRYRDAILAPGGSMPAAQLVEHFLGRQFNFKAWQAWLNEES